LSLKIYIVDVFAVAELTGNQLAVVILKADLSPERMLSIANEMNFSETVFISPNKNSDGSYPIRIFTPSHEIDFAGHPLLGAAWTIKEYVEKSKIENLVLKLNKHLIPISFDRNTVWFESPKVCLDDKYSLSDISKGLNIPLEYLDTDLPIQKISAGISVLMIPIKNGNFLSSIEMSMVGFQWLKSNELPNLVYFFTRCAVSKDSDFSVRFFFESHGVREDSATGNGAALFGNYLMRNAKQFKDNLQVRIEQGRNLNRPSMILVKGQKNGVNAQVFVGGDVVPVLDGSLLV